MGYSFYTKNPTLLKYTFLFFVSDMSESNRRKTKIAKYIAIHDSTAYALGLTKLQLPTDDCGSCRGIPVCSLYAVGYNLYKFRAKGPNPRTAFYRYECKAIR